MRRLSWLVLVFAAFVFFFAAGDLPAVGDPDSPPNTHVSPRYIEASYKETGALNTVTGVLADYRGYDTLGETVVIFTAGIASLLILGWMSTKEEENHP